MTEKGGVSNEIGKKPDILYYTREFLKLTKKLRNNNSHNKAQRLLNRFLRNLTSPNTVEIIERFETYGYLTMVEAVEVTGIAWPTMLTIFRNLMEVEIIRFYGLVERPYRSMKGGRRVKIFGLIDADPALAVEAQERYALIRMERERSIDSQNLTDKHLKRREQQRIGEWVKMVAECIPTPLVRVGDLYNCMNKLGIPKGDKSMVKEAVLRLVNNV